MTGENSSPPRRCSETRARWAILTGYERFEQVIATVLSLVIAAVIVIALFQLLHQVLPLLVSGAVNLLDPEVFHALFGSIMTLLIAMEFRHSIIRVALSHQGIIQLKT